MAGLLVDSDIIIDYIRGLKSPYNFFESAVQKFVLYISVVTLVEIYSGKDTLDPKRVRETERLLSNFEISLITPGIAKAAGELRRDYGRPFVDAIIAATALEFSFAMATRNIKHFQGLPGIKILKPY